MSVTGILLLILGLQFLDDYKMNTEKQPSQEIDLLLLFTKLWEAILNGIKRVVALFDILLSFVIRNIISMIVVVIIGIGISWVNYKMLVPCYETTMILHANNSSSYELVKLLGRWDYSHGLSESDLEKLKVFRSAHVLDVNSDGQWDVVEAVCLTPSEDSLHANKYDEKIFAVELSVYDTSIIAAIRTNMFEYLESDNISIKENNEMYIKQEKELIKLFEKEIKELDTMQEYDYRNTQKVGVGDVLLRSEPRVKKYYEDKTRLLQRKHLAEINVANWQKPVRVLYDFSQPQERVHRFREIAKKDVSIIFLLGLLLLIVLDNGKRVGAYISKARKRD